MIRRASGTILAVLLTAVALAGIVLLVLLDLLGEELLRKAWRAATTASPAGAAVTELASAKDIIFFNTTPVPGRTFEITTGVRFTDAMALQAGRVASRWCYIVITPRGGLPRQITLASQTGSGPPSYARLSSYSEAELGVLGISAVEFEALARTHCRFDTGRSKRDVNVAATGGP